MAFPIVKGKATGTGAASTTHTVTLPDDIEAGELLLVFFAHIGRYSNMAGVDEESSGPGWHLHRYYRYGQSNSTNGATIGVFYKRAEGDESTLVIKTPASVASAHIVYRLAQAESVSASTAGNQSTNANPPNHNISVTKDALWFAAVSKRGTAPSAGPSGYSDFTVSSGSNINCASAYLALRASSNNPGAFTSGNNYWAAATIAVIGRIEASTELSSKATLTARPWYGVGAKFESASTFSPSAVRAGNGYSSLAATFAVPDVVAFQSLFVRARLRSWTYLIPKINIHRPRKAYLNASVSFAGSATNPKPASADVSVGAAINASAIRRLDADGTELSASFSFTAAGGIRVEALPDALWLTDGLTGEASCGKHASAHIGASLSLTGLLSIQAPEAELSAKAELSAFAGRILPASAQLDAQSAAVVPLAGIPYPAEAELEGAFSLGLEAVTVRAVKAFVQAATSSTAKAHAIRRFLFWWQATKLTGESSFDVAHTLIRARRSKLLVAKGASSAIAAVERAAKAWLPFHKTRLFVRARKSPSALLQGTAKIERAWPRKWHGALSNLTISSSILAIPEIGAPIHADSALGVSAERYRHAAVALAGELSAATTATLAEGPKTTLTGVSNLDAKASFGVATAASLGSTAELQAAGKHAKNASATLAIAPNVSGQAGYIEGPKAQLLAFTNASVSASLVEGPRPQLVISSLCEANAARQLRATGWAIGKGVLSVQASVRRKVLVRWLNIRGSVKAFAGVQKERNAAALIDAKLFAGWGREVDSLSVEIVS